MRADLLLAALATMAIATYATRALGLLIGPSVAAAHERQLRLLGEGALLGLVASAALAGDWAERAAMLAALLAAFATRNALAAMLAGAVVAALTRLFLLNGI